MKPKKKSNVFSMTIPAYVVVDERWFVEEYREAYNTGDVPEKVISRSQYFDNEHDAKIFLEDHEPTSNTMFNYKMRLKYQMCYEKIVKYWV